MLADANTNPGALVGAARQRLSGSERRQAIVEAAFRLFSQRGFRGTTTRELASAVGVSEPVLYQHFETKRDLYNAIVDAMVARISERDHERLEELARRSDDRAFFTALGETIMQWYFDDTLPERLILFSALEGHELAELWHERATKEFHAFVENYLARRAAEGGLRVENPALSAWAFFCLIGHYAMVSTIFRVPSPGITREGVVVYFVDIFLNGIRQAPEAGK